MVAVDLVERPGTMTHHYALVERPGTAAVPCSSSVRQCPQEWVGFRLCTKRHCTGMFDQCACFSENTGGLGIRKKCIYSPDIEEINKRCNKLLFAMVSFWCYRPRHVYHKHQVHFRLAVVRDGRQVNVRRRATFRCLVVPNLHSCVAVYP